MRYLYFILCFFLVSSSCSINQMAVRALGDAISGTADGSSNGNVFTQDDDPQLVADALPFLIKLAETLLSQDPDNDNLRVTTGSLFVMYANAFIDSPRLFLDGSQYKQKEEMKIRAVKLYKRAALYLKPLFEKKQVLFFENLNNEKYSEAFKSFTKADVPLLYWYAAAKTAAFALTPFDVDLSMDVSSSLAMVEKALTLDKSFMGGALYDYLISFYASMPEDFGGNKDKAKSLFTNYKDLIGEEKPGVVLCYVLNFLITEEWEDRDAQKNLYLKLLENVVNYDENLDPGNKLLLVLSKRKAQYYIDNVSNFF